MELQENPEHGRLLPLREGSDVQSPGHHAGPGLSYHTLSRKVISLQVGDAVIDGLEAGHLCFESTGFPQGMATAGATSEAQSNLDVCYRLHKQKVTDGLRSAHLHPESGCVSHPS